MTGLARRLGAEGLGTAMLLASVVGSGIMAQRLAADAPALALLANTLPVAGMLTVLILVLGPVSGGHLNPVVTLVAALRRQLRPRPAAGYVAAQIAGAAAGVVTAHLMFGETPVQAGTAVRAGVPLLLSETVATFGLVLTVLSLGATRAGAAAVGLYVGSAYWFTASTCFANPAVTLARTLTDSFTGIRAADAPGFVAAQLLGAGLAWLAGRALFAQSSGRNAGAAG